MSFRMIFTFFPFVVFALTMIFFVRPAKLRVRAQAIWAMVLLLCYSKFLLFRAFGGDTFTPEFSEAVIWVWNLLYSAAMILFVLGFVWYLTMLIVKSARKYRLYALWILPIISLAISAKGLYNGVCEPQVKEIRLEYAGLPKSLEGYRIVHIADLHISSAAPRWRTQSIVDVANGAKGNLIVCTGDIADGVAKRHWRDIEPLKELHAEDGVWFTAGNHEFYRHCGDWWNQYSRLGLKFLRNKWVTPHEGLTLAGVDDKESLRRGKNAPSVAKAFADAPEGTFRLLLQHRPKGVKDSIRENGVKLQLSGHTHGGIFPGLAELVRRFNGGFVRGLYEIGEGKLYVSPGCGQWAGFPMRFFNPAEITVFELHAK